MADKTLPKVNRDGKRVKKPKLSEYIRSLPFTDDLVGDFAADFASDIRAYKINTKKDMLSYLYMANACDGAVAAFEKIWKSYRSLYR